MGELISIIVPVYKVENYLDRCISSIVNQTYKNLEIILVDDGSPDNSGNICDNWKEKDARIKVIHKKNGGLSDARNSGLLVATGKYISFVDSDDWINLDMYEILMKYITEENADIACCHFSRTTDKIEVEGKTRKSYPIKTYDKYSAMKELIQDAEIQQVVWNKLYDKDVVEKTKFVVNKYHEDEFWSYQVIAKADKIVCVEYIGYYYWQRAESIMGEKYSLKRLDAIEAKVSRQRFIEMHMPKLKYIATKNLLFSCIYHGQQALLELSKEDRMIAMNRLKIIVSNIQCDKKMWHFLSYKEKVWIILLMLDFEAVCNIRNVLKIGL